MRKAVVLDKKEDDRWLYCQALSKEGYQVLEASSYEQTKHWGKE